MAFGDTKNQDRWLPSEAQPPLVNDKKLQIPMIFHNLIWCCSLKFLWLCFLLSKRSHTDGVSCHHLYTYDILSYLAILSSNSAQRTPRSSYAYLWIFYRASHKAHNKIGKELQNQDATFYYYTISYFFNNIHNLWTRYVMNIFDIIGYIFFFKIKNFIKKSTIQFNLRSSLKIEDTNVG